VRIAILGGGPAGLGAAISIRRLAGDRADVTVHDRGDARQDGFGLILSPRTVARYVTMGFAWAGRLAPDLISWSDLSCTARGETVRLSGHPARAVGRAPLIAAMRDEAIRTGCRLVDTGEAAPERFTASADVVLDARGARHTRLPLSVLDGPAHDREALHAWFATDRTVPGMTFLFADTGDGVLTAHAYPYAPRRSAFIVEGPGSAWRAAIGGTGDDTPDDPARIRRAVLRAFAEALEGSQLFGDPAVLRAFRVRRPEQWRSGTVALLGDAAHSAHFSIGSGTTMALDDAFVLAERLRDSADPIEALEAYVATRAPVTTHLQDLGARSAGWWASLPARWDALTATELVWSLATRTGQGTAARLRSHDPDRYAELVELADRRVRHPADPARPLRFPDDEKVLREADPGRRLDIRFSGLDGAGRAALVGLLEDVAEPYVLGGARAVVLHADPADAPWAEAQRLAGRVSTVHDTSEEDR
jgi:2-polyprenyl-6-methoxyphenol hydroxylase-like FAD-dependent oxidoreductase